MRSTGDNIKTIIGGKMFHTELVFCDICGFGDTMTFEGVIVNSRKMDFCKRHSEDAIVSYIEMDLPPYSTKVQVKKDKDLIKKQTELIFKQ